MKFSFFVIGALVCGLTYTLRRNQRYAAALLPECLLCEGGNIDERDDGYHCSDGGFNTDWQNQPEKSDTLDVYRAVNNTCEDLRLAREVLTSGQSRGDDAQVMSANYEPSAKSYLQGANELYPTLLADLEGQTLAAQYARVTSLRDTVRTLLSDGSI